VQAGYKLAGLNLELPVINNLELVGRYDSLHDAYDPTTMRLIPKPSDTPWVMSIISRTRCSLKATMSFSQQRPVPADQLIFAAFPGILEPDEHCN
jgi:hypothetical protein